MITFERIFHQMPIERVSSAQAVADGGKEGVDWTLGEQGPVDLGYSDSANGWPLNFLGLHI